jgi:hypothetical protein
MFGTIIISSGSLRALSLCCRLSIEGQSRLGLGLGGIGLVSEEAAKPMLVIHVFEEHCTDVPKSSLF